MEKYVRTILVEDASGAQFQLHEFRDRRHVCDFVRKMRRFQLDTGEEVELVDYNTFALIETRERLTRV